MSGQYPTLYLLYLQYVVFDFYYTCIYVNPMNCTIVLGNKQQVSK